MNSDESCCGPKPKKAPQGWWQGIIYGLLPHTFCILFVVFSIVGSTVGATFAGRFMMIPYFFQFLIGLSLAFATLSAIVYLWRLDRLNLPGVKASWKYLSILFITTLAVNGLMFYAVFPAMANMGSTTAIRQQSASLVIKVALPCAGHAPLVTQALAGIPGVESIKFVLPDKFIISYDSEKATPAMILNREIFKSFKATVADQYTN